MRIAIYFLAVALCRAFDLWTTWLVTPTLDYELNPLIRWLGWRRTIAANVILAVAVALLSPFIPAWSLCLACAWWVAAGCWNLRTVWKLTDYDKARYEYRYIYRDGTTVPTGQRFKDKEGKIPVPRPSNFR